MSEDQTPNFGDVLRKAQHVQQELQRIQQELSNKTVEGSSGGGLVVARANGRSQLLSITIDREVVNAEELSMLQDLIVAAVNQALSKCTELVQEELTKITGGLPIKLPMALM